MLRGSARYKILSGRKRPLHWQIQYMLDVLWFSYNLTFSPHMNINTWDNTQRFNMYGELFLRNKIGRYAHKFRIRCSVGNPPTDLRLWNIGERWRRNNLGNFLFYISK